MNIAYNNTKRNGGDGMKYRVYIDGQAGTTGLQLQQRLQQHTEITLLYIDEQKRKDEIERKRLLNTADVVFLCLPDEAAKQAVQWVENPNTCIIDASTAHRTATGWTYGFPELSASQKQAIATSKRIANPGCHATGFIAGVYPLVQADVLSENYPFTAFSLTGYSGGGKSMIAEYENKQRNNAYDSPRQYALSQMHKHLPEMQKITGIANPPIFLPIVGDYHCGMATFIPLHCQLFLKKYKKADILEILQTHYQSQPLITVSEIEEGFLPANALANQNNLHLYLAGNDDRMTLTAVFDNLGKGASGAAVQNMNIVLGLDETTGLI